MSGVWKGSAANPGLQSNNPAELLQQIDRNTTQLLHWVRAGFVIVILLLALVIIVG